MRRSRWQRGALGLLGLVLAIGLTAAPAAAQGPTLEQIDSRATAWLDWAFQDEAYTRAVEAENRAQDQADVADMARLSCPDGEALDKGDLWLSGDPSLPNPRPSVQERLDDGEDHIDDAEVARALGDGAFDAANDFWNEGNYAAAATAYDTAEDLYEGASNDLLGATVDLNSADLYGGIAESWYVAGARAVPDP